MAVHYEFRCPRCGVFDLVLPTSAAPAVARCASCGARSLRRYHGAALVSGRSPRRQAITYLTRFGYSREQAYLILGAAPIEGRFSGVVDVPNSCATVYVPTAIFDFDIRPHATGPQPADRGHCAA